MGLRQDQLGERIGLSQLSVSRCENGDRKIDVLELRAMCRAIGVPFVEFMAQLDQSLNELEHATQPRKSPLMQTILSSKEVPPRERTRRSGPRVRSPRKPR